ncbi:hypothetical protein IPA_03130 [Ignicoccus pacificus DSM 13166]|uniref:Uncharacterized protein n=1 Tax=Ignicoccus pacificus DSM 13166 TaxID=940294 RepID=A0A977KBW0_9CREN|nr:hypothetical protein IPA_03130 [Ignicoccus pacificus DSM 13166]
MALNVSKVFVFQTWGKVEDMTSNGALLGVASDDTCAYLLNGTSLFYKFCANVSGVCAAPAMSGVGTNGKLFVFTNYNGNAYVYLPNGTIRSFKVYSFKGKLVAFKKFFVACYVGCAAFTYDGKKLWEYDTVFVGKPSTDGKIIYVPELTEERITMLSLNGTILKTYPLGGREAMSTSYCKGLLAVGTSTSVMLFKANGTKLRLLWEREIGGRAWSVTFSPDCRYIAVADTMGGKVRIYDIRGDQILVLEPRMPYSVYWGKYLYVGTQLGKVIAYSLR